MLALLLLLLRGRGSSKLAEITHFRGSLARSLAWSDWIRFACKCLAIYHTHPHPLPRAPATASNRDLEALLCETNAND